MQQQKQRIVPQNNFYHLNLIFWIVMGCGIARFGQGGLKTTKTWTFWSQSLSPCDLEGCHTLDLEGRQNGTSTSVRHPSRSKGTHFETKSFMFWWVLGPSDQSGLHHTIQNMGLTSNLDLNFFVHILPFHPRPVVPSLKSLKNHPHWIRSRFKTWKWRDIWDKPLCRLPPWWTIPTNSPPATFLPNPKDRNLLFFKPKLSGEMFQKHSYLRTLCSLALHICKLYLGNNGQNNHLVFRQWFDNHTRVKD